MKANHTISLYPCFAWYSADSMVLRVQWSDETTINYYGIPLALYEGLLRAEHKAAYLVEQIKRAGFPFIKVCNSAG
jgi:hypothetical protein